MYLCSIILIVASISFIISLKNLLQKGRPFSHITHHLPHHGPDNWFGVAFLPLQPKRNPIIQTIELDKLRLGIWIVGLELGFLMAYRAGWNISMGALVANITLALVLIPVGIILYTWKNLPGFRQWRHCCVLAAWC